jgi:twitching motility protein PilT
MATIDRLLKFTVQSKASDLHISVGSEPLVRLFGGLRKVKHPVITAEQSEAMLLEILSGRQQDRLGEHFSLDLAYDLPEVGRFRCNVFRQRLGLCGVFRVVPSEVPTLDDLKMPPVVTKLLNFRQGLILVTGPAGCGKTTSQGAMINYLNEHRPEHIITVEDPIEIVHENKQCVVSQREVVRHTQSFAVALRAALREDPDIILIGEMRDLETISMGITSAETGHLVLGTLHTTGASRTISRLVDVFPTEQMAQIRAMVSESIRGVLSQRLLPRKDGSGLVAALEIMVATPAIAHLIREDRTFQIPGLMQIGAKQGMKLMDDSLMELVHDNVIDIEEAIEYAENKKRFFEEKQRLPQRQEAEGRPEEPREPEQDEAEKGDQPLYPGWG